MDYFISICVFVLAVVGLFVVVSYVIDIITFDRYKCVYGKINTEPIFIDEVLRNLLNEEIEKNNDLIAENRRLETEKYKLVQELNKHS